MTNPEVPRDRGWLLDGQRLAAPRLPPGLYVVATPIGNMGDITLRSLRTLAAADVILAEDTRVAGKLAERYGLSAPRRRFDAHASPALRATIVAEIAAGGAVALVSDAGTPLLSDPGGGLVADVAAAGLAVFPIPGASALLAALVVAGVSADVFTFAGFLPPKSGDRRRRLRELADAPGALILYEAPHRVREMLEDALAVLGDRPAATARELTKIHESVVRGGLAQLVERFAVEEPRGEFVILIGQGAAETTNFDLEARLAALMADMSVKDAASVAAAEAGLPRREVYARALLLQRGEP
ncbi:MAG: 16S rRNA (cytidine(1402)-2'-O)-methyltransferase [Beijerinckiaceae bacterium]